MLCPDQPRFHLASQSGGWSSDPNGPFFYKGWWHLFHQHLPGSSKWDWGLQWSHAVSRDKVHWRPLPPAIVPTPGGLDQDGAFSGCACIDEETGIPYLFYTGVRLRSSPTCGPIPPAPYDLNLPFIESQLIAWPADPEDPLLQVWVKGDVPIISLPLPNVDLAGWRDAFLVCTPKTSPERVYKIMFGSGIKGKGGLILVYKSKQLTHGWEFDKFMCVGKHEGPTDITGVMWEMPLLAKLPITTGPLPVALGALHPPKAAVDVAAAQQAPVPSAAAQPTLASTAMLSAAAQPLTKPAALSANGGLLRTLAVRAGATPPLNPNYLQLSEEDASQPQHNRYFFSISPDACTCPTLYWLGNCPTYDTFDVHNADGPHKLDLGDVLYAPNLYKDPEGRILLLAWMQERRKVGEYAFAGCVSLPRMLTMDASDPHRPRLLQQPMPELAKLRTPGRQYILGSPAPSAELPHVEVDTDDFTAHQLKHRDSLSPLEDVGWQEAGRAQRHAAMMMEDEYAEGATARQEHRRGTQAQGSLLAANGVGGGNGTAAPRIGFQERAGDGLTGNGHAAFASAASQKHNGGGGAVGAHAGSPHEPSDTIMVHGGQAVTIPGVSGPFLDIEIALMPANPADGLLQPRPAPEVAPAAEAHQGAADGQGQAQPAGTQGQGAVNGAADGQPPGADAGGDGEPQASSGPQEMQGLMSGLALRSWVSGGSAAVLYNWREGTLEVVYEATEPGTHNFSLAAPDVRRVGGVLRRPPAAGEPLRLRLLLDGSLLEIFTGEGEALSTRVYRGVPATNDAGAVANGDGPGAIDPVSSCAIDLISVNGDTVVKRLEAYEMGSIWEEVMPGPVPAAQAVEELIQAALKL